MTTNKDAWDKAETISKFLIPVAVAFSIWLWNHERTKSEHTSRMSQLAVSALTTPAENDRLTALRKWALDVLDDPMNIEPLSEELREQLIAHFSTSITEINTIDESLNPNPYLIYPELNSYERLADGRLEGERIPAIIQTLGDYEGLTDDSTLLEIYEEHARAIDDLENQVGELLESIEPDQG